MVLKIYTKSVPTGRKTNGRNFFLHSNGTGKFINNVCDLAKHGIFAMDANKNVSLFALNGSSRFAYKLRVTRTFVKRKYPREGGYLNVNNFRLFYGLASIRRSRTSFARLGIDFVSMATCPIALFAVEASGASLIPINGTRVLFMIEYCRTSASLYLLRVPVGPLLSVTVTVRIMITPNEVRTRRVKVIINVRASAMLNHVIPLGYRNILSTVYNRFHATFRRTTVFTLFSRNISSVVRLNLGDVTF